MIQALDAMLCTLTLLLKSLHRLLHMTKAQNEIAIDHTKCAATYRSWSTAVASQLL